MNMVIELGDSVKNKKDGSIGLVTRIFDNGQIQVLEIWTKQGGTTVCTHDSSDTLEVVEKHFLNFKDERGVLNGKEK